MVADKLEQFHEHADSSCSSGHTALPIVEERDHRSLLVVDDNDMNRDLLSRRLRRRGYDVTVATGGADAIDCLTRSSFDAILLDIMMPNVNGWDVLKWIRDRHSREQLPVIMVTAKDTAEDIVRALELGANDYLTKPFDLKVVLARVATHVSLKRTSQSMAALNQKLAELARHDALTGVLNRNTFIELFQAEWQRSKRYQRPLSCVMLDIDFFKRINDTFGHATGDRVLEQVAHILRSNSRTSDLVGRFGGEEFCILLSETAEQNAVTWCERVRQRIAELAIPVDGQEVKISASFGLTSHTGELPRPKQLIEQADEAMLIAKRLGRNRVVVFERLRELGGRDESPIWGRLTAKEIMIPLGDSLSPQETISEAVRLIQSEGVESITVLNADGLVAGVIDVDDIMTATLAGKRLDSPIQNLMKTQLVTYRVETRAREICEFLCRSTVRQVLIVDGEKPLGKIRRADFMRWISQSYCNTEAESLESQLSPILSVR